MAGAGYKTFNAGDILTASDVQTYLQDQVVATFATTTARDAAITSPSEGQFAYSKADDTYYIYSGTEWLPYSAAWISFTPTLTNVTTSTLNAAYFRTGKVVHFYVYGVVNAAPTGIITVSLPVTSTSVTRHIVNVRMSVAGTTYFGSGIFSGSGTTCQVVAFNASGTYVSSTSTSGTVPGAWVSGNTFLITGTYEAA